MPTRPIPWPPKRADVRPLCTPCWRACLAASIGVSYPGPEPRSEWESRNVFPNAYGLGAAGEACFRCGGIATGEEVYHHGKRLRCCNCGENDLDVLNVRCPNCGGDHLEVYRGRH